MAAERNSEGNRFGAPYLIYTYTLIVVLLPIIFDMSIVTITNIFQVITFFMNVTVVYAIFTSSEEISGYLEEEQISPFQCRTLRILYHQYHHLHDYFIKRNFQY